MAVKIIGAIFIAVVGPLIVWMLIQKYSDKPVLKYNLSEAISTTVLAAQNEYIQELYIKNVGNDEAKKISIKFPGTDVKYQIKKNSATDDYKVNNIGNVLDINYDSLTPSGEIRIIIHSHNKIYSSDLKISHSKGMAVDVFTESNIISKFVSIIFFTVMFSVLSFIVYGMYAFNQTFVRYGKEEMFLSRKKPVFISDKKWTNSRNEAMGNLFAANATSKETIKASFSYRFLNNKVHVRIPDSEIDTITNKCVDMINKYFHESAYRAYNLKDLALLFTIEQPINMPDDKWEEITTFLSSKYISQYLGNMYLTNRTKLSAKDTQRPEFISKNVWKNVIDDVNSIVTGNIISEILTSPFAHSDKLRDRSMINSLSSYDIQLIERVFFAYSIFQSTFLYTRDDATRFIDYVNKFTDLSDETVKVQLLKYCHDIVEFYDNKSEINEKELLLHNKEAELSSLEQEIQSSRNKVLKQSEIIDCILNRNNAFLEKIEDYDMPFSPGNQANLRVVASILQERG